MPALEVRVQDLALAVRDWAQVEQVLAPALELAWAQAVLARAPESAELLDIRAVQALGSKALQDIQAVLAAQVLDVDALPQCVPRFLSANHMTHDHICQRRAYQPLQM